tara:strand:+ start:18955 stop:24762 length:5808 start_codon:yes stop_codon:yes gene_type:complete
MPTGREHFALVWIKSELLETLNEARESLEAFAESDGELTHMRTCLTAMHQVHGTLVMLELEGLALLADHLERLAQQLMGGIVSEENGAVQCLMQGILELPGNLDEIQRGLLDSAELALPLINEIRRHLGEEALAGGQVTPLSGVQESAVERFEDIDGNEKAKKIRAAYQQVLLSILKGGDRSRSVEGLNKVAQGLTRVCEGTPHESLWQAFGEFVAGLGMGEGPIDGDAVKLLRRVDSEMRQLAADGTEALRQPVSLELIRQLLESCRQRNYQSEALEELRATLHSASQTDGLAFSGREALASAAAALREELATVKDQLDLLARGGAPVSADLGGLIAPLKQIGSTLSLLGFESSKIIVADQVDTLNRLIDESPGGNSALITVASALVQVDENLASFAHGKPALEQITDDAQRAVIVEARAGLERVKQAVVEYISSQWTSACLEGVPEQLEEICGALGIIPLERAARLLAGCGAYVAARLMGSGQPRWDEMDALADAISGVEYYLERLGEESGVGADDVLDLVARSLQSLGIDEQRIAQPLPDEAGQAADAEGAPLVELELPRADAADVEAHKPPVRASDLEARTPEVELHPVIEHDAFDEDSAVPDTPAAEPEPAQPDTEPAAANAAAAEALTLVDVFDSDQEIVEIFTEEVGDVLEAIAGWLPRWREDFDHEEALGEVRRAFHTLKGSARTVGANVIGEVAWSVENMLNRVLESTVIPTDQLVGVVDEARALVVELREAFEAQRAGDMDQVGRVMERADILASGGTLEDGEQPEQPEQPEAHVEPTEPGSLPAAESKRLPGLAEPPVSAEPIEEQDSDALFAAEVRPYLDQLRSVVSEGTFTLTHDSVDALHGIAASAALRGMESVGELAQAAYELARVLHVDDTTTVSYDAAEFFLAALSALAAGCDAPAEDDEATDDHAQLIADADLLVLRANQDRAGTELVPAAALVTITASEEFFGNWHEGALDLEFSGKLVEALSEVAKTASAADREPIADLARAQGAAIEHLEHESLTPQAYLVLSRAHSRLLEHIDALATDEWSVSAHEEVLALRALVDQDQADADTSVEQELGAAEEGAEVAILREAEAMEADNIVQFPAASADLDPEPAFDRQSLIPEDLDEEIVGIFFEEADEILEVLEQNIHEWSGERNNRLYLENLLRGLHTLKGGARLAGLVQLGDLTHQFESHLIEVQGSDASLGAGFFAALNTRYDDLTALVGRIRHALSSGAAAPAVQPEEHVEADAAETTQGVGEEASESSLAATDVEQPPEESSEQAAPATAATDEVPTEAEGSTAAQESAEIEASTAAGAAEEEFAAPEPLEVQPKTHTKVDRGKEMVRVGAGLLEELVNLAGESSIVRARVEQDMSDFTSALDEMEVTIERVREQLRRLQIETEAQTLFRRDSVDEPGYTEFDPLEMDRYSQLQQVSRELAESASDMLDLKETLLFKARESETLLLQQARINTELQEGLMRTRMVPFSRLLPRLRRIVRQVSAELDKEIDFSAYNVEGELDRNLLERMVPPLEHMLRNAADHGIESADLRKNFGKPSAGRIELRLSREGGDVVIEISDDGAGIDVESVREKAVERGLVAEGAALRDEEITQFVLAPGFSTAKSVTQISGRGVGMDVVHSEVKQLGGSIHIRSRPGKGTRFTVRVPFTVSVNRSLMVSVGEDLYAIPLNNIEGIVLLDPDELETLYAPEVNTFEYAGVPYRVRYLGHYLGREFRAASQQSSVPVVLVRSGDQSVAVHVDAVQGSREIVVKSLGPQFAGVGGVSGATILGDGSVVVILDMLALIRAHGADDGLRAPKRPASSQSRTRCVMVVDDSVTVRKVTSRLLERQGMDVIVAKDGAEAVALLQERRPDLMLLDIEMPRMDGFEVARQVRRDERLKDLPIVMISSRTGKKHQERAAELAVNSLLGKPFQESELLSTIDGLVN